MDQISPISMSRRCSSPKRSGVSAPPHGICAFARQALGRQCTASALPELSRAGRRYLNSKGPIMAPTRQGSPAYFRAEICPSHSLNTRAPVHLRLTPSCSSLPTTICPALRRSSGRIGMSLRASSSSPCNVAPRRSPDFSKVSAAYQLLMSGAAKRAILPALSLRFCSTAQRDIVAIAHALFWHGSGSSHCRDPQEKSREEERRAAPVPFCCFQRIEIFSCLPAAKFAIISSATVAASSAVI
jgi:hypothetical protein